jgi:hypothetical protein
VRRAGAKPWFDIFEIANELAYCRTDDQGLIVLFDWTHIAAWKETAPPIDCAAFVHSPKFNRHVAILSALLRMHGAKVRSFRDIDAAGEWLRLCPREMVLH